MFVPIESSWREMKMKKGAFALLRNRIAMSRVWRRHIVAPDAFLTDDNANWFHSGFIMANNLTAINLMLDENTNGEKEKLSIAKSGPNNFVLKSKNNTYKILYTNIGCENGVIHIIDRLMLENDDPVAELNVGNPRIVNVEVTASDRAYVEEAGHIVTTYDDYGSTVDSFSSLETIDLTHADNGSVTFYVDSGDFHNISMLGTLPLPAFTFTVPEWDVHYENTFVLNSTSFDMTKRQRKFTYFFSKFQLANSGICKTEINPVAAAIPGHHQGRAYLQIHFSYGPVVTGIEAEISNRGCLFTCKAMACPTSKQLRIMWAFSADKGAISEDDNDEAFSLGNVAENSHQLFLDTFSCGRMVSSVTTDGVMRSSMLVACRASTTDDLEMASNTFKTNFFDLVTEAEKVRKN